MRKAITTLVMAFFYFFCCKREKSIPPGWMVLENAGIREFLYRSIMQLPGRLCFPVDLFFHTGHHADVHYRRKEVASSIVLWPYLVHPKSLSEDAVRFQYIMGAGNLFFTMRVLYEQIVVH